MISNYCYCYYFIHHTFSPSFELFHCHYYYYYSNSVVSFKLFVIAKIVARYVHLTFLSEAYLSQQLVSVGYHYCYYLLSCFYSDYYYCYYCYYYGYCCYSVILSFDSNNGFKVGVHHIVAIRMLPQNHHYYSHFCFVNILLADHVVDFKFMGYQCYCRLGHFCHRGIPILLC